MLKENVEMASVVPQLRFFSQKKSQQIVEAPVPEVLNMKDLGRLLRRR